MGGKDEMDEELGRTMKKNQIVFAPPNRAPNTIPILKRETLITHFKLYPLYLQYYPQSVKGGGRRMVSTDFKRSLAET